MASFVIHHIAGEQFLNELEKERGIELSDLEKQQFLLGNLIVDSSRINKKLPDNLNAQELKKYKRKLRSEIQEEKKSTHFRNEQDENLCIQAPNITKFIKKYPHLVTTDYTALGYLYHLYVDKQFFDNLFRDTFETLDQNGNYTPYLDKLVAMKIKKNGKIYCHEELESHDSPVSIYHDYTVMNKILLEHYGTTFDPAKLLVNKDQVFQNPGIEEVDYQNISKVVEKTKAYIAESYQEKDEELHVFSKERVQDFIKEAATNFIKEQTYIIDQITGKKPKVRRK